MNEKMGPAGGQHRDGKKAPVDQKKKKKEIRADVQQDGERQKTT